MTIFKIKAVKMAVKYKIYYIIHTPQLFLNICFSHTREKDAITKSSHDFPVTTSLVTRNAIFVLRRMSEIEHWRSKLTLLYACFIDYSK